MAEVNERWLPHLNKEVASEMEGNYLDAYVVALEGWRRGLTLRWHIKGSEPFKNMKTWFVDHPGQLFSLHSEEKSHYFFRTRGDKVTNSAVEKGMDKAVTKQLLQSENIAVPEGKLFTVQDSETKMTDYAEEIGYPVVIKPVDGSFGRGVITNIKNANTLLQAIQHLRNELKIENIVLEKHITGKDVRLYVVDDTVFGAILRVPPNVTGDGVHTIEELIELKNKERNKNPRLANCPIQINQELTDFISRKDYSLETIPDQGQQVYLNNKGNVSIGGDPIDILEELSPTIKELAVSSLAAVPGLVHGAVDILVSTDENGEEQGYVIELNPTAQIGGILFPNKGKSRDIPKAIIDYYFPETKNIVTEREKIYFDFHDVLQPLISRQGTVSTVSPAPLGKIYMRKYTVFGDVQNLGYHLGLRKQAFERGLHGYVMNVGDAIQIVVAGLDLEMVYDFKNGITEDEERSTVIDIHESDYHGYVKVGFDSRANLKTIEEDIDILKEDIRQTSERLKRLEISKRKYLKSFSWRITFPIRLIGALKNIFRKQRYE